MSGQSSKSTSSSSVSDITPTQFSLLRDPLAGQLQNIFATGGGEQFQGPFTAGIGGQEQGFLDMIAQQGQSAFAPDAQAAISGALQGGLFDKNSPFIQDQIEMASRPIQEAARRAEEQDRAFFTTAGQQIQESSPFARALGEVRKAEFDALRDVGTQVVGQNVGQRLQAAQQQQQLAAGQFQQTQQALEAVALPRLIEQMGIDRGLEEFQRRMAALMQAIGIGGDLAFQPAEQSESKSISRGGGL